jgi:hypothetical protein
MAQHDQVIDDGPGLAVRTDMNAAYAALFSSNSGPIEPSVKNPGLLWFDTSDTTKTVLKIRDNANATWVPVTSQGLVDLEALAPNLAAGDVIIANGPNDFGNVAIAGPNQRFGTNNAGVLGYTPVPIISDFRNKIINGDFNIWQYANSQTSSGYGSDNRWVNTHNGSTKTHSLQSFPPGQTVVPGQIGNFSRTVVASVAGAGNYCFKQQRIEYVQTLQGRLATVTFWAKADAAKNIAVEIIQLFGTGGSPSATVTGIGVTTCALTTAWQKFSYTVQIPSIAGMTLGTNGDHFLSILFWLDAGSTYNSRTNNLGQQSGTFDLSHVSLVDGDATHEDDPFSPRLIGQEFALCQRYYQIIASVIGGYQPAAGSIWGPLTYMTQMRVAPSATFSALSYANCSGIVFGGSSPYGGYINASVTTGGNATVGFTLYLNAEL